MSPYNKLINALWYRPEVPLQLILYASLLAPNRARSQIFFNYFQPGTKPHPNLSCPATPHKIEKKIHLIPTQQYHHRAMTCSLSRRLHCASINARTTPPTRTHPSGCNSAHEYSAAPTPYHRVRCASHRITDDLPI